MTDPPVALTVAGSDSGGGAGVQADLKTFEACGAFGTSALTAVTAQNTTGVTASEVLDPAVVRSQFDAVVSDFPVAAAKTGMLGNADVVATVADAVADADFPVVVDPVAVAQSGDRLLTERGVSALREDLLPEATLATPNVPEAELLADVTVADESDLRAAAEAVLDLGPDAVLLTGGHLDGDPVDVFVGESTRAFTRERVDTANTHGSGCTLSAAITAHLARGDELPVAVERGVEAVTRAIESGLSLGAGNGPVDHDAVDAASTDALADARSVVAALEREWPTGLVPEVGTNVAVAPPDARTPDDVVAVDGRLHATQRGVRAAGGVAPGASSHVARFLLGVRERDPAVSAAANVRWSEQRDRDVRERWDAVVVDRAEEPADADGTMDWTAREAMKRVADQREATEGRAVTGRNRERHRAPDAVVDSGAVGKEAMIRVLADDAESLEEKLLSFA
ncbi:bifunctional hydroxymethylpyrimidine kinase/phosphomethylpyrimidine kinase [Halobacterium zhouii]|uniref:bifunctional hydroxymethylpyrimidine kinase/phosphomethylpyrimidine kinase n=1 Tax=Halobacterium zhouii TaxID=2902624 RepID=UPI001E52064C|nr:bifunctional hydroxymethylpyrimidine kinase/phosphomethylpyrimidine kinase [Halobacterium zhouii]